MKQDNLDEDYLISRARKKDQNVKSNTCGIDQETRALSKAWLITSRLILPKNFNLQYEDYSVEKENNQIEDAAKTFKNLFDSFAQDRSDKNAKLWQEIDSMIHILSQSGQDHSFLKRLFQQLPSTTQRDILMTAASSSKEPVEKLKRLLLAFQMFPDLIPIHCQGPIGLVYFLEICKQLVLQRSHLDEVLTLFMTEFAPLILAIKSLQIIQQTLHEILLLAFEFVFISIMRSKESIPWSNLIGLFGEIGVRLGWPMAHNLIGQKSSMDLSVYHQLVTLHQSQQKPNEITHDQIFFIGSLIFFKCLADYTRIAQGNDSNR